MKYKPNEFVKVDSREFNGFWGVLGKREYEDLAAWIINHAQKLGRFEFMETKYNHSTMIEAGYLIRDEQGKVMLTDLALDEIHAKYAR